MKETFKKALMQVVPILISAGAAAGITFLQSLASAHGACPEPNIGIAETGALGAGFKAIHTAFLSGKVNKV